MAHNHDELSITDKSKHISPEMISMIINCAKKRMTVKKIIAHIENLREKHNLFKDETTPTAIQMYYILRKNKIEEAPPIISIGSIG